jgi:iron complex transport system substrate-binding protein
MHLPLRTPARAALLWSAVLSPGFTLIGCGPKETSVSPPPAPRARAAPDTPAPSASGFPRTVTDMRGKSLTLSAPPKRIVSLAPSNTELLFALGLGDKVVGDTSACDWPKEAKDKPHVSGAGGQIDTEKVVALNPDLVVSIGAINPKANEALEKLKMPVLDINPKTVAETYDAIRLLGKATGQDAKADALVREMQTRIEAVRKKTLPTPTRPKVLILYGVNPIYTTGPGSFIDDVIQAAGGQNVMEEPGSVLSPEKVVEREPDVIICDPALREKVKEMPGWADGVPAVRDNRFFETSKDTTLVRPGPRLALAAEELARYLHPEAFPGNTTPPERQKETTTARKAKRGSPGETHPTR